jgi:ABC-type phosphate transport system permease subunit
MGRQNQNININTPGLKLTPTLIEAIAAALFAVAIIHTFSTKYFERLAHRQPVHAGLWHLLGEVEIVFGFWAMIMMLCMFALEGQTVATHYLDTRNFTEPMFVFAIMVIAGTPGVRIVVASSDRVT